MEPNYRKIVIGSVARLPVSLRNAQTLALEDLESYDITVRITDPLSSILVADEDCQAASTLAWFDWDTVGLSAGKYLVQFTFTKAGLVDIEPVNAISVVLTLPIGE